MDTVPDIESHLETLRISSATRLQEFITAYGLETDSRIPTSYLDSLNDLDKVVCWRAVLLCYSVTRGRQIPREMQLQAVLADSHGLDSLISAGTGSGKTLPTALKILLDSPADKLTTLTSSPLKRLQVTQENDFISKYGIYTVVINEDTPRDSVWWDNHVYNPRTRTPGLARHLIVTVEQLFKTREGHLPWLGILIRNNHFQKHIIRVIVSSTS